MKNKILLFIVAILLPFLAGGIGSYATYPAISGWYAGLIKPPFNPPNAIFGPVWSTLYLMMGIAFYLVLSSKEKNKKEAVVLFLSQLVLNLSWSLVFFGLKSPLLALLNIGILWLLILFTIKSFYRISNIAGILLIPYILWVSFATILNFYIVLLN